MGKVVLKGVMQKKCSTYTSFRKRDLPIPEHKCNINHYSSLGSMESILCKMMLEEVNDLSDGRVVVTEVMSDDDSTIRSHCAAVENGGKLAEGSAS